MRWVKVARFISVSCWILEGLSLALTGCLFFRLSQINCGDGLTPPPSHALLVGSVSGIQVALLAVSAYSYTRLVKGRSAMTIGLSLGMAVLCFVLGLVCVLYVLLLSLGC